MVPALLGGGAAPSSPGSPSDQQLWDATVTALVRSTIGPSCTRLGGDLYILSGRGRLGPDEDGDKCQAGPLWSAACCASPEGRSDFSLGLIREAAEGEKQVSVRELEEALGAAELFSEGCRGADGGGAETAAGLPSKGLANTVGEEVDPSGAANSEEPEGATGDAAQTTSADAAASEGEEQQEAVPSGGTPSADESPAEQEADGNSSSVLLLVVSTAASILTAPLRPVFSTVTQLPGQVMHPAAHQPHTATLYVI